MCFISKSSEHVRMYTHRHTRVCVPILWTKTIPLAGFWHFVGFIFNGTETQNSLLYSASKRWHHYRWSQHLTINVVHWSILMNWSALSSDDDEPDYDVRWMLKSSTDYSQRFWWWALWLLQWRISQSDDAKILSPESIHQICYPIIVLENAMSLSVLGLTMEYEE
jgi:hypothetical protein